MLAGSLNYSSTLKMEAIRSSETSGTTLRTTLRHIPEDDTLPNLNFAHSFSGKLCSMRDVISLPARLYVPTGIGVTFV
jgi:hypothetical protein